MTLRHSADLVERHTVSVPVPDPLPSGEHLAAARQRAWAQCADVAETWGYTRDLEIETNAFETQDESGDPSTWGVRFVVVIGRGLENPDPRGATSGRWTWSERWRTWLTRFRRMDGPELKGLRGGNVIPLRAGRDG